MIKNTTLLFSIALFTSTAAHSAEKEYKRDESGDKKLERIINNFGTRTDDFIENDADQNNQMRNLMIAYLYHAKETCGVPSHSMPADLTDITHFVMSLSATSQDVMQSNLPSSSTANITTTDAMSTTTSASSSGSSTTSLSMDTSTTS